MGEDQEEAKLVWEVEGGFEEGSSGLFEEDIG